VRVKIDLLLESGNFLPYNRNYIYSSWIYNCLELYNPSFSDQLHYRPDIKGFVFSDFIPKPYLTSENGIQCKKDSVFLFVSSPRADFISNFVHGLLEDREKTRLFFDKTQLSIRTIETLPEKSFEKVCVFKCLSPVTASTFRDGKIWYLRPHEQDFYHHLSENLRKKYLIVHGKEFKGEILVEPLFEKQKGKMSFLIDIKGGKITAFKIPFRVSASPEMNKIAYDCGLGEKNSQGFGMLEVL